MAYIENGDGNGRLLARVDKYLRVWTRAVIETRAEEATRNGDGFNLNTGFVNLTSANESAILYFRNNEDKSIFIDSIITWRDSAADTTGDYSYRVVRNPTGGTIVSSAVPVDILVNRDTAKPQVIKSSLAYKGAEADTITGGENIAIVAGAGRFIAPLNILLQSGQSIAVVLNPMINSGSANTYAVLIAQKEAL